MYTEMRVIMGDNNWSYSKIYKEIIPYEEYGMYDVAWHDGMSAADGHIGVITSCAPLNDSLYSRMLSILCRQKSQDMCL